MPALSEMTSFLLRMKDIFRQNGSLMSDVCLPSPCFLPVELVVGHFHAETSHEKRDVRDFSTTTVSLCVIICAAEENLKFAKEMWKLPTPSFSGFTAFYNPGVNPSKPLIFPLCDVNMQF